MATLCQQYPGFIRYKIKLDIQEPLGCEQILGVGRGTLEDTEGLLADSEPSSGAPKRKM